MSLFVIDASKCKKDNICVAVCPIGNIENVNGGPAPARHAEESCINCGHCVAVCPTGAFSHRAMKSEQCAPIRSELLLKPEQADQFLRARRSIRTYRPDPVEWTLLQNIIETASSGPSGHNTQPVEWLVIHDTRELRRLTAHVIDWMRFMIREQPDFAKMIRLEDVVDKWEKGYDAVCRSAPHVVLTHAHKDNGMAPSACTIALAYVELSAYAHGLGACWAGYFDLAARHWPPLRNELGLPDGNVSYGTMMIGYPKFKYHRIPVRRNPRILWK